jgi:uncharacterized repeat protein (TIGR01451 family)
LVAQNNCGINYGNIVTFTTTGSGSYGNAPLVTTKAATYIYQNSALLNGNVNPNGGLTNAWFEWGTTPSLGNSTAYQPLGNQAVGYDVSFAITNLQPNTTYYFRINAQNPYGISRGNILSFTTQQRVIQQPINITQPSVIVEKVYVKGEIPTVTLTPSVDNTNPNAGDNITLTIVYNNSSNKAIKNSVLRIILPSETSYESSNLPPTSIARNNLNFNIGTIAAKTQGVITVKIHISNEVKDGDSLMFNMFLEFTDANGNFQSISAFLNVIVKKGISLGASLIDFLGALFRNWLFDLLLGLVLGFGIYHFFIRSKETDTAA